MFKKVSPYVIVCPACGVKTVLDHLSDKEFWKIIYNDRDTIFAGLDCRHNQHASTSKFFDKNGNEIEYPQEPNTLSLKAYFKLFRVKRAIVEKFWDVWYLLFGC